jgi:hypothetical protein
MNLRNNLEMSFDTYDQYINFMIKSTFPHDQLDVNNFSVPPL